MAKELPYFKFEPSEWQNGDIQMLDAQTQLTFINICCTYWNRLGKLPYAFALHKHCNGNAEALDLLISCNIIKLNDSNELIISFLDLQLKDVKSISSSRSNAAKTRWAKGNDANALQMQSKSNAIRQDKIREDKIKEDNIIDTKTASLEKEFKEFWIIYDKKIAKEKCFVKWKSLPKKDIAEIFEHVKKYIATTTNKKYRKDPLGYLTSKKYKDEIIAEDIIKPQYNKIIQGAGHTKNNIQHEDFL